jgi:MEDS: MEthanogen/methylotroph, DcmR Sensory domain
MVHLYQEADFLVEAVVEFVGTGLKLGEGAVVIARPKHRRAFAAGLAARGVYPSPALRLLDASESLAQFIVDGRPQWNAFRRLCGGAIAELRLQYPTVRAYGEMVDVLWQEGNHRGAIALEGFWTELARLQPFSLLCAYRLDPLDGSVYGGALESVCKAHTHLIPARDYARFNQVVAEASKRILDQPLAQMLLSLSARHRPQTDMPLGQATLLWLKQNMPRTADRVLSEVRALMA